MTHRHVALAVTLVALLVTAVVPASAQSAREQGSLTDLLGLLQSDDATAEDMKAALARFEEVLGFQPPPCDPKDPMFNDVPASSPFCPFIEELARRDITSGCGGGNFCPGDAVTRAQMATFIVKTLGEPRRGTRSGRPESSRSAIQALRNVSGETSTLTSTAITRPLSSVIATGSSI